VYVDEKECQERFLWDAVLEESKPAPFAVSGGKGEAAITNHLNDSGGSRGGVWGNCPLKPLWRPFEWRRFAINAHLFGDHGSRNIYKNTLK